MAEYRIEELALKAGTTVRNVRAYRDRGLLAPPRREGRVALYSDAHVGRLALITDLLSRGYTLANIRELLAAWERGSGVDELIGLEAALAKEWSDEFATTITRAELTKMFGAGLTTERLEASIRMGVIEPIDAFVDGDEASQRFRVNSPRQLNAGAELVAAGIPLEDVLAYGERMHEQVDTIAEQFVELVTVHLFEPFGAMPPPDEVPRLISLVERLRPLAERVVDAELARAMERHVRLQLGNRLGRVMTPESEAS